MHFEENQLSPCSIGISPLPTAHPSIFQHTTVRSSTRYYPRFNLAMGRSHGFGSNTCYSYALFRLAFATPTCLKHLSSQHTLTRRLILQKARRHPLQQAVNWAPTACRRRGFRNYFTPLPGCFSPFPHGTYALSVARGI